MFEIKSFKGPVGKARQVAISRPDRINLLHVRRNQLQPFSPRKPDQGGVRAIGDMKLKRLIPGIRLGIFLPIGLGQCRGALGREPFDGTDTVGIQPEGNGKLLGEIQKVAVGQGHSRIRDRAADDDQGNGLKLKQFADLHQEFLAGILTDRKSIGEQGGWVRVLGA